MDSHTVLPKGNKNVCFKAVSHEHDAMILLAFSSNLPPPPVLKDSPAVLLPHDTAVDLLQIVSWWFASRIPINTPMSPQKKGSDSKCVTFGDKGHSTLMTQESTKSIGDKTRPTFSVPKMKKTWFSLLICILLNSGQFIVAKVCACFLSISHKELDSFKSLVPQEDSTETA